MGQAPYPAPRALNERTQHEPRSGEQKDLRSTIPQQRAKNQSSKHQSRPNAGRHPLVKCYKPIAAYLTPEGLKFKPHGHDVLRELEIPCGMCIGCREKRASEWQMRIMHEAKQHDQNSFITLTYSDAHLPANGSLHHRDFQLFLKRFRKLNAPKEVRFYMAGEYGDKLERPHYHACIFGHDFRWDRKPSGKSSSGHTYYESNTLNALWGKGKTSVQDLTPETASYCARYIMKKQMGKHAGQAYDLIDEDGVIHRREPEYNRMSLKPGIGHGFITQYAQQIYRHDQIVMEGRPKKPPRYYDRIAERMGLDLDDTKHKRELAAREHQADNTPERLAVAEKVHQAKLKSRSLK